MAALAQGSANNGNNDDSQKGSKLKTDMLRELTNYVKDNDVRWTDISDLTLQNVASA